MTLTPRLVVFGSGSNVLRLLRAGWTRHDSEDLRNALDDPNAQVQEHKNPFFALDCGHRDAY